MAAKKPAPAPSAPAVFRDANSHCCLRVLEEGGKVHYIQLEEEGDSLIVDLHHLSAQDFAHRFTNELRDYPAWRAAAHFCNPLTPAISVTDRAFAHLETILKENDMTTTAAKKTVKKTTAQKNVDATAAASVKTDKTTAGKPVAPVTKDTAPKGKGKAAGQSPAKPAKDDGKPGKKAGEGKAAKAAPKASKAERDRQSYGDKKIKALVKSPDEAGLRAGTIRSAMLAAVLKAKNTDEILGKEVTVDGVKHAIAGNNLAGMVERGHIELS